MPENRRNIVKKAIKVSNPVLEKVVDLLQRNAVNNMKNFKNINFVPKEIRDAIGDIVEASADPLNSIIDSV